LIAGRIPLLSKARAFGTQGKIKMIGLLWQSMLTSDGLPFWQLALLVFIATRHLTTIKLH
jgi:hypothetical protein